MDRVDAVQIAAGVEGWMAEAELGELYDAAARVPADQVIIDIGTYRGRSAVVLALGSAAGHDARVYTFDPHLPFSGARGGTFDASDQAATYANLARAGVGELVYVVSLDSKLVAGTWPWPVGLLLIDGDHRREAVAADFAAWREALVPRARVFFDDIDYEGVAGAVGDVVAAGQLTAVASTGKLAWYEVPDV